jgi:hypothetical protein
MTDGDEQRQVGLSVGSRGTDSPAAYLTGMRLEQAQDLARVNAASGTVGCNHSTALRTLVVE